MTANRRRPVRPQRAETVLLLAACLVCYANGLTGNFTYDDKAIVRDDVRVHAPSGFGTIFTTPYFGGPRGLGTGYRPLLLLSFAVQWWVHDGEALGFHLGNVALHALVAILFARFLAKLDVPGPTAFGAAMLFAVHPIHVEAVTSLVGRGETLAAAFVFGFLLAALEVRRRPGGRIGLVAIALVCYALGLLTKESAAVAPVLAFLAVCRLEEGTLRQKFRTALRRGLPLYVGSAALLAASFLLRRWVLGGYLKARTFRIFELENPLAPLGAGERASNAAAILLRYVGRLLVPLRLSADESAWSIPVRHGLDAVGITAFLLLAALSVASVVQLRRRPETSLGFLFFAVAFAPTANVLFPTGTIFAERLAYLPSAGFTLVLATAILGDAPPPAMPSRRRVGLLFAVALFFAARTIVRNPVWKDDEALFTGTARTSPGSAKAHYNLAWVSEEKGRLPAALEHYTLATRIYPKYFDAWAGRGLVEQRLGNLAGAEKAFIRSLAVAPTYENGFFRLGFVRELFGDLAGAERAYADGLAQNPKSTPIAFRLALLRSRLGRPSAEANWRHAIALARGSITFRLGYARWLFDQGRMAEARREAREVLRRRPRDVTALRLLADASRDRGQRFAEGLAVEKILPLTRAPADLDRLLSIAAEDASYRARFAVLEKSLRALRSEPAGHPGDGAFSVERARPPADAGGDRSGAQPERPDRPRDR